MNEWKIDHSAGRPILVYNNCSVIEAEQAEYILELIRKDKEQKMPESYIGSVLTTLSGGTTRVSFMFNNPDQAEAWHESLTKK